MSVISNSPRGEGFNWEAISTTSIIIEIKPRHSIVGFWPFRLFFDTKGFSRIIKFDHPISLGILHPVAKYHPPGIQLLGLLQNSLQTMAIKDIIPQDKADLILADKFFP